MCSTLFSIIFYISIFLSILSATEHYQNASVLVHKHEHHYSSSSALFSSIEQSRQKWTWHQYLEAFITTQAEQNVCLCGGICQKLTTHRRQEWSSSVSIEFESVKGSVKYTGTPPLGTARSTTVSWIAAGCCSQFDEWNVYSRYKVWTFEWEMTQQNRCQLLLLCRNWSAHHRYVRMCPYTEAGVEDNVVKHVKLSRISSSYL